MFGPKLPVPEKRTSRSSSPLESGRKVRAVSKSGNNRSTDSDASTCPRPKKFGNPIRVENLALSRSSTPSLPLLDVPAKNKWMRDSSVESSSAFVVLDREVNNNNYFGDRKKGEMLMDMRDGNNWMPSWYNSNSSS